ncbi:MAG: enoyl-CoA hydratase/isomerase family protein [bacterium]|nr:enoyl-CoA hydratase/isomerase family protein [bacterium]
MDATDELLFEIRDEIAWLTFNRPQARNALTFAMYEGLAECVARIDGDPSVKALVIAGAGGKAFAAGTDISQFRAFATPQDALAYEQRMDRVLSVLEHARVPTIAAIAGACTGGGAGIAAACDLRIGTPSTRIGFPIARTLGNTLSMGNFVRLASLIGIARVKEIIFTARLVPANEAHAIGLLNELVPEESALLARAEALARTLAAHAPLTLRATKEALLRIRDRMRPEESDDLILSCYMSADFREGMEAFLNKRAPRWRGA